MGNLHAFTGVAELKPDPARPERTRRRRHLHAYTGVAELKPATAAVQSEPGAESPRLHGRGRIEACLDAPDRRATIILISTPSRAWPN